MVFLLFLGAMAAEGALYALVGLPQKLSQSTRIVFRTQNGNTRVRIVGGLTSIGDAPCTIHGARDLINNAVADTPIAGRFILDQARINATAMLANNFDEINAAHAARIAAGTDDVVVECIYSLKGLAVEVPPPE